MDKVTGISALTDFIPCRSKADLTTNINRGCKEKLFLNLIYVSMGENEAWLAGWAV